MYCVNCGVRLEDTEKKCPLCGTVPYHPEIQRKPEESLYPPDRYPKDLPLCPCSAEIYEGYHSNTALQ